MENLNEGNNKILTDEERDKILYDLLEAKEGKLDSSFLYKGKGAQLYEKISKDPTYPFINREIECLRSIPRRGNKKLNKVIKKLKFITDVGCGDGQKAITLLSDIGRERDHITYIAEDYSGQMLDIAEKNIRDNVWGGVKIGSSQKLNDGRHLSQHCSHNMYLFLGGTLCNYTDEKIKDELKGMDNNGLIEGNYILLSYFTAPNTLDEIKELIEIYNSENNRAFHENGMEMLGLSKDDFEYDTIYETDNGLRITLDNIDTIDKSIKGPFPGKIKGVIRAKNDNTIKLSSKIREKEIKITKGEEFTLHYSRRFTKKWIEQLFKKSGCRTIFTVDKKGDSIALLKRNPTKSGKMVRAYKDTIRNILILGGLTAIYVGASKFAQEKDVEKTYKTYNEQESKEPIGSEPTFYAQETEELITALKLDKLHNKKGKKVIIDLFNAYVGTHKTDSTSTEELIQGFWKEQGGTLIRNYNLTHNPYDFMTKDLITETKKLKKEFSSNEKDNRIKVPIPNAPFEYNDSGKTYGIIKVYILGTPIYLASKKEDYHYLKTTQPIHFSTDVFNDIKNKAMLDPDVLENNNKFGDFGNLICLYHEGNATVYPDELGLPGKTNLMYLNGKIYYIRIATTSSGKTVGIASESEKGEFTTTKFNEIAEEFSTLRKIQ